MYNIWEFNNDIYSEAINYHNLSRTDSQYTYAQIYYPLQDSKKNHLAKQISITENNKLKLLKKLSCSFQDKSFSEVMRERRSFDIKKQIPFNIDKDFLSDFCNLSFIGLSNSHRAYASGGSMYEVNIFLLFDPKYFKFNSKNVAFLDYDSSSLCFMQNSSWLNEISNIFLQKDIFSSAKFGILLSINFDRIFDKYTDIGYKLVQQEVGYIGQNIQLVSAEMGVQSIPLQGYYDDIANSLVGNNQTVLSAFLCG